VTIPPTVLSWASTNKKLPLDDRRINGRSVVVEIDGDGGDDRVASEQPGPSAALGNRLPANRSAKAPWPDMTASCE